MELLQRSDRADVCQLSAPVAGHDEGIVVGEDVAVAAVREGEPVGPVEVTVLPVLVVVVSDPVSGPARGQPVAAPQSGPLHLAEAVYRDPVPEVADDLAGGRQTDRSPVVVVPTLRVGVTHAAVEGLALGDGGHTVVPVLVVVEEGPGGGDTFHYH